MSTEGKQWLTDNFPPSNSQRLLDVWADALTLNERKGWGGWGRQAISELCWLGQEGCIGLDTPSAPQIHVLPGISEHEPIWKWRPCRGN